MTDCDRLVHADNIAAAYSEANKALIISADVTINPYSDLVHICRNPLELLLPTAAVHEYMVVATTRPGIHPDLAMKRTISASFSADVTPAKVAVYSMGVDNPLRSEISVTTQAIPVATQVPQTVAPASGASAEATGWSTDFVFQDALSNALTALRAAAGFRNPDVGLPFEVVAIGGQIGGFTLHTGVFVKVKAA